MTTKKQIAKKLAKYDADKADIQSTAEGRAYLLARYEHFIKEINEFLRDWGIKMVGTEKLSNKSEGLVKQGIRDRMIKDTND